MGSGIEGRLGLGGRKEKRKIESGDRSHCRVRSIRVIWRNLSFSAAMSLVHSVMLASFNKSVDRTSSSSSEFMSEAMFAKQFKHIKEEN